MFLIAALVLLVWIVGPLAAAEKANILVIWRIGVHNISAYNHGIMGYQTPKIETISLLNLGAKQAADNR